MNRPILYKTAKELISLKEEFVQFASETEADKIHLGDFDLMKRDVQPV